MAHEIADVVALTQELIRNRCVNDGDVDSGDELRNADLLQTYLEGGGLDVERYHAAPGRTSLVARVEGTDPDAPTLCLLGHTDVVPVNAARWEHDPFGGELIDGYVWGRGAIDMFNVTAAMVVAVRRLADGGFRPRGTLVVAAVADEEAGGHYGAEHLALEAPDAVRCDYAITESGGFPLPTPSGVRLPYLAEEKGPMWATLHLTGTPGHGSMPFRTDNALLKAADVVRRLADYRPPTRLDDAWRRFVEGLGVPEELAGPLLTEEGFVDAIGVLPLGISRMAYSCTHTTITPTLMHAGSKLNIIPEEVEIGLDIRTLPGDGAEQVREMIDAALGELAAEVEVHFERPDDVATASPAESPLVDAMARAGRRFYPGAALLPMRMVGTTDARHFRRHFGAAAYGFGIFSAKTSLDDLATMGHGDNERVDVESLHMGVELWEAIVSDFLA